MYQVTFNYPNMPEGAEFQIAGINGTLVNGSTYDFSAEEANHFAETQSSLLGEDKGSLEDIFHDNKHVTVAKRSGEEG